MVCARRRRRRRGHLLTRCLHARAASVGGAEPEDEKSGEAEVFGRGYESLCAFFFGEKTVGALAVTT